MGEHSGVWIERVLSANLGLARTWTRKGLRDRVQQYSSQSKNNYLTDMCSGLEEGSYSRLIDFGISQL